MGIYIGCIKLIFLEIRFFITLYNDAFRNWEFNTEIIFKNITLLFFYVLNLTVI